MKNEKKRKVQHNLPKSPDMSLDELKKEKAKLTKFFLGTILGIALLTVIVTFMFSYEGFNIVDHDINGITYCVPGSVDKIAAECHGKNIFSINKHKIYKQYLQIREIEDVQIKRKLPNKIVINIKEKQPVCCFKTPSGKYLLNNQGLCFHKLLNTETVTAPTIAYDYNKIVVGSNILTDFDPENVVKNKDKKEKLTKEDKDKISKEKEKIFEAQFLFNLAKTCHNNKLNVRSIQLKNKYEILMVTNNNMLIKFGAIADIVDKTYLLKQIYKEKHDLLNEMKEIYIINSTTATYKLKNNNGKQSNS